MSIMHFSSGAAAAAGFNANDFKVSLGSELIEGSREVTSGVGTVTSGFRVNTDGSAQEEITSIPSANGTTISDYDFTDWFEDKPQASIGDLYEVFVSSPGVSGGTSPSFVGDSLSTWLPITSNRIWTLTDSGDNVDTTATVVLTVSIRNAESGKVVADPVLMTLTADLYTTT